MAGLSLGNLTPVGVTLGNKSVLEVSLGSIVLWPMSTDATISPISVEIGSGATSTVLYITDRYSHGWTLTGGNFVTKSASVGTGSTTVTVSAPANPTSAQRTDTLTFTDRNTSVQTGVYIIQQAAAAAQSLIFAINPGTYTVLSYNAYEIDWTLGWDRDLIDVIDSGVIAQPMYYGDVIQWGTTDYTETIPSSQFGTTKRVFYELVVLDIDGNLITQQTGNAEVTIPSNPPASQLYVYLNLPTF